MIVRNKKSPDSRKKLEADSIIIQSPHLKKALGEILSDYPGICCDLERLVFRAPFQPFVHRWPELEEYLEHDDLDEITKEHLELLYSILKVELKDAIKAFEDYIKNGVVTFEHMWMIFQPGQIQVETRCGNVLRLRCEVIDWSGKHFGRGYETIDIYEFNGIEKIPNLNAYPMAFCEKKDLVKMALIERGQKFESLAGHQYKAYSGAAITWDNEGREVQIQISGRIVVDNDSFNRYSPYPVRGVNRFNSKDMDRLAAARKSAGQTGIAAKNESDKKPVVKLTSYHQLLCRSRVRGYSIKTKKWLDFFVDNITDITWNNNAFESLVLPEDQKELVLAFSESQVENRASFDDVIQGKGKGIIMLLSGPPGVGKTLTAEAVAENMRVPLHTISSGDLGSSPWEVERGLSEILDLVARWNAILLLDECDVFLEARSTHDLERNKIVSIFLRTLEYYEGILFMTTNRVDNIDQAFQSRIHVSMQYPDLTTASRRQIWANFLRASKQPSEFSETDLDELATVKLNGRQIKNILKTAQLLALRKGEKLSRKFVQTVMAIEQRRPEYDA